ncbi:MAG TPA: sulfotransferase [Mucilaginibacter sp.]|jgi:Sulfotransferase domain.
MLEQIVNAEKELEKLLPQRRLQSRPPAELISAALKWSELVWREAETLGPMPLTPTQIANGLAMRHQPVFICGVHRSGTTLVQNLLDSHPQLSVLPSEGTFYTNQELKLKQLPLSQRTKYLGTEWLRRMVNPINQQPYWLLGQSGESSSPYVDFARYVWTWWNILPHNENTQWPHLAIVLAYASCTNNLTALAWVDKTPTNERFLQRIWSEFPEAKIVHVVRDPIATLTSRKVMEPGITLRNALRYLKISYRVATDEVITNDPRFFLLRYEDLCDAPDAMLPQLARFLNIDFVPGLQQATTAGMPASANSSFKKDALSGTILKSGEHLQREVFTSADKKLIAACVGAEAGLLGYPMDKVGGFDKAYAHFRYALLH